MKTLEGIIKRCWSIHRDLLESPQNKACLVQDSIPILWFGDMEAYRKSKIKVVTVGLNPSLHEFPKDKDRFPKAAGLHGKKTLSSKDIEAYTAAMNAYFETEPYRRWFSHFEKVTNCLGVSYYSGKKNRAVHIDIYSPFATNPVWGGLSPKQKQYIDEQSTGFYEDMLDYLNPDIVLISVSKVEMEKQYPKIHFEPLIKADKNGKFYLKVAKVNRQVVIWGFNNQGNPFGIHKEDSPRLQQIMNKIIGDYAL